MRQKYIAPTIEVRASAIHGRGVFATSLVRRGTMIGTYEGERARRDGRYVLWIEEDDGTFIGINGNNDLRFLNHSRTPNAVFWGAELFALRNIEPGTELTIDYGKEWAHVGREPKAPATRRAPSP